MRGFNIGIIGAGQSSDYQKSMSDAGVKVEWIPLDELTKGYGAAHCMTQVIKRAK